MLLRTCSSLWAAYRYFSNERAIQKTKSMAGVYFKQMVFSRNTEHMFRTKVHQHCETPRCSKASDTCQRWSVDVWTIRGEALHMHTHTHIFKYACVYISDESYVCVCLCMYVCMYACIYACRHAGMYVYIIYTYIYVCVCVCMYVRTYVCMYVRMYVGMYV